MLVGNILIYGKLSLVRDVERICQHKFLRVRNIGRAAGEVLKTMPTATGKTQVEVLQSLNELCLSQLYFCYCFKLEYAFNAILVKVCTFYFFVLILKLVKEVIDTLEVWFQCQKAAPELSAHGRHHHKLNAFSFLCLGPCQIDVAESGGDGIGHEPQ